MTKARRRKNVSPERARGGVDGRVESAPRAAPTPILVSRRFAALAGAAAVVVLALVVHFAPAVPTVAFGGLTLALVLSYPVRALSRVMPRGLAILVTVVALVGAVVLALAVLVPILVGQLQNFFGITPQIAAGANDLFRRGANLLRSSDLPVKVPRDFASNLLGDFFGRAQELAQGVLGGVFGFVSGAFNLGVILFGIFFVAVYLLVDVRKIKAATLKAAPRRYRRDAGALWDSFGISLSRYLGGLVFIVCVQGALSGAALFVLGVPYFVLLGAWVSLTAVVPYLGPFMGAVPAVVIALLFTTPTTAVLVVILYITIQQLEGNLLTPRIQGRAVRVHPIVVLLAVLAGGQLGGIPGVVFAVPALAVSKVLLDFLRERVRLAPKGGG